MQKPLYVVGSTVKTPPNLYDETQGVITSIEKIYQEVDRNGNFNMTGLAILEDSIQSFAVPWKLKDETLTVTMPKDKFHPQGQICIYKFYGYAYCVSTEKMNSVFNEESLQPTKEENLIIRVAAKLFNEHIHSTTFDLDHACKVLENVVARSICINILVKCKALVLAHMKKFECDIE